MRLEFEVTKGHSAVNKSALDIGLIARRDSSLFTSVSKLTQKARLLRASQHTFIMIDSLAITSSLLH